MFDLKTKVAIVTGGNGGIGLGMARGLARAGATVVVAARDAGKSAEAVRELQSLRQRGRFPSKSMCATKARWRRWSAGTVERCGRLDILVNNAGINIRKPAQELTLRRMAAGHRHQPEQRLPVRPRRVPAHEAAGGGKVINIGSMLSIFGASFAPAYAASKGGVVQLTKSLAVAWAKRQHPGERGAAGLDRHRADARARGSRWRA